MLFRSVATPVGHSPNTLDWSNVALEDWEASLTLSNEGQRGHLLEQPYPDDEGTLVPTSVGRPLP